MNLVCKGKILGIKEVQSKKGNVYFNYGAYIDCECVNLFGTEKLDFKENLEYKLILDYDIKFKSLKLISLNDIK